MPLESAGVFFDDNMHTGPPVLPSRFRRTRPVNPDRISTGASAGTVNSPPTVNTAGLDTDHSAHDGKETCITRLSIVTQPRLAFPRSGGPGSISIPGDLYSAWPDPTAADVFGASFRGDVGTGNDWFGATTTSLRHRLRNRSQPDIAPPDLFLGVLIPMAYVFPWQPPARQAPRAPVPGFLSQPDLQADLLPGVPPILVSFLAPDSAWQQRPVARTPPQVTSAPGEFSAAHEQVVAWDTGGTTLPTPAPRVRREVDDLLPISANVALPELTVHITADVTAPARAPRRPAQHVSYDLSLDSDFLGPLPATFVYGPQSPTRSLPRSLPATDGTLRELPDATEAIEITWHTLPQPPTRPLFRTPPEGSGSVGGVWFGSIEVGVLMEWDAPVAPLARPLPRRPVQAAGFDAWTPLGEPIGWYVAPETRRLARPGPTAHEYTAAPSIYSSGATIIVSGPYYAVAQQLYTAGAVAAQSVSE